MDRKKDRYNKEVLGSGLLVSLKKLNSGNFSPWLVPPDRSCTHALSNLINVNKHRTETAFLGHFSCVEERQIVEEN